MPKDKWPQWRLTFKVADLAVLQVQPINAAAPAAAVIRGLEQLETLAGRREGRHIRLNLSAIEVERI